MLIISLLLLWGVVFLLKIKIPEEKCPHCKSTNIEKSEWFGYSHEESFYVCKDCEKTFDNPE